MSERKWGIKMPVTPSNFMDTVCEKVHYIYYDVLEPKEQRAQYPMFLEPLSSLKGISKTNMHRAGRLIDPEWFKIEEVTLCFKRNADTNRFRANHGLRLVVGYKSYLTVPLLAETNNVRMCCDLVESCVPTISESVKEMDTVTYSFRGNHVSILQGQSFQVEVCPTDIERLDLGDVCMYVLLEGTLYRAVQ